MKRLFVLLLLITLLLGCSPQEGENPGLMTHEATDVPAEGIGSLEPSSAQIEAVNKAMEESAVDRWTEYSAVWSAETGLFILSATAGPSADGPAVKSYCRILDGIASEHLEGVKVSTAVYFQSGAKIECK